MTTADPITLELYRHRFAGVAEEMGITLQRTSYSPNIKERLDFSCALFDHGGHMIAQAAHIPAHLGAMPASVQFILTHIPTWAQGDVVIVNDPFAGGNHLPDITMITPVFVGDQAADTSPSTGQPPTFFVASRAHHADVGGMTPGSLPLSTEIYQEGIIIPPVKLYRAGALNEELLQTILRNVRTPEERRGDLAAQRAAHAVGERRLLELIAAHGLDEVNAYAGHLQAYSERLTRAAIAQWPDGVYQFEDVIEWPDPTSASPPEGRGEGAFGVTLAPIRVTATIAGDEITFDFAGTAGALHGSLNAVIAITQSACYYVVRCLVGDEAPMNSGCFAPVRVIAPDGCLVNARAPAAVAGGNVETSQRITDVVLGALAQAGSPLGPTAIPAASQGTMNNLTIGGQHPDGEPYAYYETIGGGMGASAQGDGMSAVQVHMTNTLNTPVEALEMTFPFRVTHYGRRPGSGGQGQRRGGDGVIRAYELLAPATVTVLSERRTVRPWGLAGGDAGQAGRNLLVHVDGSRETLPGKFTRRLAPGDRLVIETPGGGGWGAPIRG
ncbi:MAG: hydantoinase B/oxoprolinase family protein [Caldilineaceae bacterium]|nr:hydantoinase B/oxoprolinase family protein [Caldilineaceae bacterium]